MALSSRRERAGAPQRRARALTYVPVGAGATPAPGREPVVSERLSHQALIYRSQTQLTATTAAFVRVGLEAGDPVLVAAKPTTLDALRAGLGPDAGQVELHAAGDWFPHPFQRLQEMCRLTAEARPGTVVRLIDEWPWDGSDAATREWARLESVTNHVLAGVALRLVSLFDARSLPASVLEIAVRTHPELIENGAAVPSPGFVAPDRYLPGAAPDPPCSAADLPLPWPELRVAARSEAERLGVAPERLDDVVLAVQEVATNAERHGAPPVRIRLWRRGEELVCQVTDGGRVHLDPRTGWLTPDNPAGGGWGLPIARLTCDAVEIGRGADGTVVTLSVTLGS